ncbi:hypothetical protein IV57_GL000937 [Companilactobacillus kimchiensis]|uniref:Surface layer protein A domain-containing protein n=1 Tax=Companilactobacillus kimchiensis TaxID=993692 RepID=A0A0R2LEY5_9LACO|nr:hypothetical protein IV57_GL000937 [Companilactobacillus kimchiensis]
MDDGGLSAGSAWYSDKVATIGSENNAVKYYHVATNEWVKASDGSTIFERELGPKSSWLFRY